MSELEAVLSVYWFEVLFVGIGLWTMFNSFSIPRGWVFYLHVAWVYICFGVAFASFKGWIFN